MKHFTLSDVKDHSVVPKAGKLYGEPGDLIYAPLEWQRRGYQQTASGYGAKLTSPHMISFEGRLRRIYLTCYGNSGSAWFTYKRKKIFVH